MSSFVGGPADGKALGIVRAPRFLRVVIGPRGRLDALDQLEDVAEPAETIHVYEQVPGTLVEAFVCGRPRSSSGFQQMATYRHRPDVEGEAVRETEAWRSWCRGELTS